MRWMWMVLLVLVTMVAAAGAQVNGSKASLGMNLSGPADWSTELPFVDVFRLSRTWISQKQGEGWGKGPELKVDKDGWITQLEEGCWAETPLCTIHEGGHYPSGDYVLLYDGEGEFGFTNATVKENKPGRLVMTVDSSRGGFFLQLKKTNPQNYVRNIRVIMPGFEKTYEQQRFHPVFLERWQGMKSFRYMDWMSTNGSKVSKWEDRPTMSQMTWTRDGGIPLEVMIEHANLMKADPWFCMPHLATDEYVRNFAQMVKEKLDPSLKIYVELSNEMWNSQFEQTRHGQGRAKELGLGPADRPWEGGAMYYVQRSVEMFKIWEDVFGGKDRLVRVIAWQAASGPYWLDGMVMARTKPGEVDALAIAPYMSMNLSPQSKPSAEEVSKWTVDQIMDHVQKNSLPESVKWINEAAAVAKKYNVKLVCYEAGQHLVGVGGGENFDELTKLLHQANASERMGEAYRDYYAAWEKAGGDLLCNFSSVSSWSKWGSWGLVQYYDQGPKDSPKLRETLKWAKSLGQKVQEP